MSEIAETVEQHQIDLDTKASTSYTAAKMAVKNGPQESVVATGS